MTRFGHLARVVKKKKYGFINKTGSEIVPCIYRFARPYIEGFSQAEINDSCFFLNLSGQRVMKCYGYFDFSEGLAVMVREGKYGFMDKTGKEVITCQYEFATNFKDGYAAVKRNNKCGIIGKNGDVQNSN